MPKCFLAHNELGTCRTSHHLASTAHMHVEDVFVPGSWVNSVLCCLALCCTALSNCRKSQWLWKLCLTTLMRMALNDLPSWKLELLMLHVKSKSKGLAQVDRGTKQKRASEWTHTKIQLDRCKWWHSTAFVVPLQCLGLDCRTSDEMAAWLGGQEIMSRPQITSFFWAYIKTQNLLVCSFHLHPAPLALVLKPT